MEEQKKIREILQKRGIEFKIFSNFNSAAHDSQEYGGTRFSNLSEYTGVITDLNFPVSENTNKERPFGLCLYKIMEKAKIPCILCTKNNAHDDNGWSEMMLSVVIGIQDDSVVLNKDWEEAVEKLVSKIKEKV